MESESESANKIQVAEPGEEEGDRVRKDEQERKQGSPLRLSFPLSFK